MSQSLDPAPRRTEAGHYLGGVCRAVRPAPEQTLHITDGKAETRRGGQPLSSPYLRSPAVTGALGLLTSFPTVHKRAKRKSLPSKDLVQNPAL